MADIRREPSKADWLLDSDTVAPSRLASTELQVSDEAREYVATRGGTLWLRVRQTKCCSGGITFLEASTAAPRANAEYTKLEVDSLDVQLMNTGTHLPATLSVEVRGRFRPRLVAYWDGCAYRL